MSIDVTPTNPTIAQNTTQQFTATGNYSDSTILDLAASVIWSSSEDNIATISNGADVEGMANSLAVGSATITATDSTAGISGNTTISVTSAVLITLAMAPTKSTISLGSTQQFTATGIFSDNSTQDLTKGQYVGH